MKGVPIKFRGKRIDGNGYAYGDLNYKYDRDIWIDDFEVYVNSVAQLVGYDADNNEVYEGDILVNDTGKEFEASIKGIITCIDNLCYRRYLDDLKHKKYYRLKGR